MSSTFQYGTSSFASNIEDSTTCFWYGTDNVDNFNSKINYCFSYAFVAIGHHQNLMTKWITVAAMKSSLAIP